MIKKRKLTITWDIDTETHIGKISYRFTENGKPKKNWSFSEALTVIDTLTCIVQDLAAAIRPKSIALDELADKNGCLHITKPEE